MIADQNSNTAALAECMTLEGYVLSYAIAPRGTVRTRALHTLHLAMFLRLCGNHGV